MTYAAMVGEFISEFLIGREFIRHKIRFPANCCDNLFTERFGLDVRDVKRTAFAVAFDKRHDGVLLRFLLRIGAVPSFAADESFVAFDNLAFAADGTWIGWRHRFADAMAHEPSGTVGTKSKHAPELMRTHAFLA